MISNILNLLIFIYLFKCYVLLYKNLKCVDKK